MTDFASHTEVPVEYSPVDYNSAADPEKIRPKTFNGAAMKGEKLNLVLGLEEMESNKKGEGDTRTVVRNLL